MAKKTITVALENMTREELKVRYEGNIAEKKRLSEENNMIRKLWNNAAKNAPVKKSLGKKASVKDGK